MQRTHVLLVAAALTAGCASGPVVSAPEPASLSIDACVLMGKFDPSTAGYVMDAKQRLLQAQGSPFGSVTPIDSMEEARDYCDVVLKIWQPSFWSTSVDVFMGAEEKPSFSLRSSGPSAGRQLAAAVAKSFSEGSEHRARALAAHEARPDEAEPATKGPAEEEAAAGPAPPEGTEEATIKSDVDQPAYGAKAARPDDFALVVGVEKYSDLPDARFAERDARAVRSHLLALGYPERNVIFLTGAKAVRSSLEKYVEAWLPRNVTGNSQVFVYFSGHGAPDVKTGQAFLVPWDGDPKFLDNTGYPLKRLYEKLSGLKAKRIVVVLDSCFSGAGGRSVLAKGARPLVTKVEMEVPPTGKLVVLAASSGDEITSTAEDQGHGLLTYYFLRGLAEHGGEATIQTLYDYLKPKVEDAARRDNRDQTPQLIATDAEKAALAP